MSKETDNQNESVIPNVSEASNTLGDIRINHSVVASIVRLAALEAVSYTHLTLPTTPYV